jgi:hypothetical protein
MNGAQRELQGTTVDTRGFVSVSSPSHKHSNFILDFMIFLSATVGPWKF